MVDLLVHESNRCASQKNLNFAVNHDSMYAFLGILYLSGYHHVPRMKMMWSNDDDVGIPAVRESLTRRDFEMIKSIFHLNDNNLAQGSTDRLFKIRPLIEFANNASTKIALKQDENSQSTSRWSSISAEID